MTKLNPETTVGDGNCSFNAFILGLAKENVLNQIEKQLKKDKLDPNIEFEEFIARAGAALGITDPTWASVKKKILEMRRAEKVTLQKKLAPIIRDIAIERAKKNPKHLLRTQQPLLGAFRDHIHKSLGITTGKTTDDIYSKHDFIVKKFRELSEEFPQDLFKDEQSDFDSDEYNRLKASKDRTGVETERLKWLEMQLEAVEAVYFTRLLDWWLPLQAVSAQPREGMSGYEAFLLAMKLDGQWGGDLELAEAADYFRSNLDVVTTRDYEHPHHMHMAHGVLPIKDTDGNELTKSQINQLIVRGIVDKPGEEEKNPQSFQLLPLAKTEVEKRLSAIPEFEKVGQFIESNKGELKFKPVDEKWGKETIAELVKRDVVGKVTYEGGTTVDAFIVTYAEASERIREVTEKDKLVAAWDEHHKESPTITTSNPYGLHYENMLTESELVNISSDTIDSIFKKTMEMLESKDASITPSAEKWELLLQKAEEEDKRLKAPKQVESSSPSLPETDMREAVGSDQAEPISPSVSIEKTVEYTLPAEKGVKRVTIKTQIELDEEYAKQLQQQEHKGLSKEEQEVLDRKFAEQLQREFDEEARLRKLTK